MISSSSSPAAVRFLSVEPLLEDLGTLDLREIDWVIVGGESGPGARPIRKEWVLSIRDQCQDAGVPFFFKQWGGVRKKALGRRLEGKIYDGFPRISRSSVLEENERLAFASQIESSVGKNELLAIRSVS